MENGLNQDVVNYVNDIKFWENVDNNKRDVLNKYGTKPFFQSLINGDVEKCLGDIYRGRVNTVDAISAINECYFLDLIDSFKMNKLMERIQDKSFRINS